MKLRPSPKREQLGLVGSTRIGSRSSQELRTITRARPSGACERIIACSKVPSNISRFSVHRCVLGAVRTFPDFFTPGAEGIIPAEADL